MPTSNPIGKGVTVVHPPANTIKSSIGLGALSAAGIQITRQTSPSSSPKIEKQDQADPTEIVAVADFNRIFDTARTLTPYGEYYKALDVVHAVTTDDVVYVVNTSIEKDNSGQWTALRDTVENDIADADALNDDLIVVDAAIKQACESFNFLRKDDPSLQEEAEKFLENRIKTYETAIPNRIIDIDNVLQADSAGNPASERFSSTGGGAKAIKEALRDVISSDIVNPPDKACFDNLGQTHGNKDLNPSDASGLAWNFIDNMNGSNLNPSLRLYNSAKMLSYVLGVSTGIRKVEQSALASRISFSSSKLGSIFEGVGASAPVPYRRSKSSPSYGNSLIAMSLLQFDSTRNDAVIPIELEDSPDKKYKSGPTSLVRESILSGDYNFSDFTSYIAAFDDARQDIEDYAEMMLGRLDPENNLTPDGILRIIISNFIDAIKLADSSESSRYQLAYTSLAGNSSGIDSRVRRQRLLQIAGRIKSAQLADSSTGSGDDAVKKISLITTLVSEGSENLTSDASSKTTQTQDKSDTVLERVIARTASSRGTSSAICLSPLGALYSIAQEGILTAAELQSQIDELKETLKKLKEKRVISDGGQEYTVSASREEVQAVQDQIDKLQQQLVATPTSLSYDDSSAVAAIFDIAMRSTDGSFWSCMIKAYDDLIAVALSRLPDNVKMTDELGKTLHGAFDEFGLLSFIVECFVVLASQLQFIVRKGVSGLNPASIFDSNFETKINLDEITQDDRDTINKLPGLAVDFSSAIGISKYADELSQLISIDQTPESLATLSFLKAGNVKSALDSLRTDIERYQNALAYLKAFATAMSLSKDNLITAFMDVLATPARRAALDNPQGRQMMSNLTTQQMVYRRSLTDKYRPSSIYGYLPSRFVYSESETTALRDLLSSTDYSSNLSENTRIVVAAVPAGTIDESKKYNDPELGKQSYTGMIELVIHRRDHELDDLIFREKTFLFDPHLYVMPDSFINYERSRGTSTSKAALQIAKKLTFKLYSRDGVKILSYNDFSSQERYQSLNKKQIDQVVQNTTLSYLLETYLFKTTGMVFDESITLDLDDSISNAGLSALTSVSNQSLPDLILPNAQQLELLIDDNGEIDYFADIPGLTTGDRELISCLKSSYIMRSEKPIDRLLTNCGFDRVFIIPIDPDSFIINIIDTVMKNGSAGRQMLASLRKQGLLRQNGSDNTIIPRDPLTGGFAIGDISCQFIPHTANAGEGSLLKAASDAQMVASARVTSRIDASKPTATVTVTKKSSKPFKKPKASKGVKL